MKNLDSSVVVQDPELAMNLALYGVMVNQSQKIPPDYKTNENT